jgi:hypothetical protein
MKKHKSIGSFFLIIIAIVAQACTQGIATPTQEPEILDPVAGAQLTLAAATQKSLEAVAMAQQTIAAANPQAIMAANPGSVPSLILSLSNDPSIEAIFTGKIVCSQLEINLKNLSPTTSFKSVFISMSVKDDPSGITVTSSTNGFLGTNSPQANTDDDCLTPTLLPSLDPGASYTVFFPKFTEKEGNTFEGSILLCPEYDLLGKCSKNSIVFTAIIPVTGDILATEITPSPAPSPLPPDIFQADYVGVVHPCPEAWWVRVNLTNKFNSELKSVSISVKDTVTNEMVPSPDSPNVFTDQDQNYCDSADIRANSPGISNLEPNTSFIVSSGKFLKDPTGHPVEATLKLCTEDDLVGQCSEKTISFTPGVTVQATVDTTKPTFPYIILSAGTYCRTGPGTEYQSIGAYAADTKIPVLGKDPTGKYLVVASPNKNDNNIKCWLTGLYVKESGNLGIAEIYPVPPTPTPTPKPTSTPTPTATSS